MKKIISSVLIASMAFMLVMPFSVAKSKNATPRVIQIVRMMIWRNR